MLTAVVAKKFYSDIESLLNRLPSGVAAVEWRLDYLAEMDVEKISLICQCLY